MPSLYPVSGFRFPLSGLSDTQSRWILAWVKSMRAFAEATASGDTRRARISRTRRGRPLDEHEAEQMEAELTFVKNVDIKLWPLIPQPRKHFGQR